MTAPTKTLSQQLADQYDDSTRANALITLMDYAQEPLRRYVTTRAALDHVEDICAETWKIAFEHISAGIFEDRGDDPIGYVIGIARLVSLRYGSRQQRRQQREVALDETVAPMVEDGMMDSESRLDLASLRQALPDPEDQAVLQALLADQTINDMAHAWNCHYKTAWRRFHRFLDHSRDVLGDAAIPA